MTYVKDEMLNLAARMTDMSEDLISESDIRAGAPLLSKPKRAGRFSAFMNHPAMVAVLCAVVSLGVVAAIVMAGRGGPDVPPVVETPHVEDSETGTENEKETESEIELVYSEGLIFHKNGDGTYKITSIGTCTDTELVIPPTYEGIPVTAIDDMAFFNCDHLTSVIIPDTVTSIGRFAFSGQSLVSISIPDGIQSIGHGAFGNAQYNEYNNAYYVGNEDNPYLALIRAFSQRQKPLEVHENTKLIADGAFAERDGLATIILPDSIEFIGINVFDDSPNLAFNTYGGAQYLGSESNPYLVLVKAETQDILSCEVHEMTRLISGYAFSECKKMQTITIPDSVSFIGVGAFNQCSALTEITIPDGVAEIKDYTFYYCKKLASVTLPDSVTRIGYKAFEDCGVRSLIFSNSLTYIADDAFRNSGLRSIVIPDSVTHVGESAFRNCAGLTSVTLSKNMTVIEPHTFDHCNSLLSITIPEGITEIGARAFYFCLSLKSVTLPTGLMRIDYGAFEYCTTLTSAVFHEGLTSIGERVFGDCNNLTSITIPKSVTSIGATPFGIGEKLRDIYYAGSEEEWNSISKDNKDEARVFIPADTTLHFNSVP